MLKRIRKFISWWFTYKPIPNKMVVDIINKKGDVIDKIYYTPPEYPLKLAMYVDDSKYFPTEIKFRIKVATKAEQLLFFKRDTNGT